MRRSKDIGGGELLAASPRGVHLQLSFDCWATTAHDEILSLISANRELNSVLGTPKARLMRCGMPEILEVASC